MVGSGFNSTIGTNNLLELDFAATNYLKP